MEEKRREAGAQPAASGSAPTGAESSPAETASSRRRASGQKRKANALAAANAASTSSLPSKRITREKNLNSHQPIYNHNGPLTRARGPNTLASSAGGGSVFPDAGRGKLLETSREAARLEAAEEANRVREAWEALEAKVEAEFEAIRSRESHVHVVPNHCGWFSWTKVHSLEEQGLPSFFDGKSQDRNPVIYMEIRNWIMKKFHANPNKNIASKDLSELDVGVPDAKQEVMEFLEYWGLINFHPFSTVESASANADVDKDGNGDGTGNADGDGTGNADGDGTGNADGDGTENADGDKVVTAGNDGTANANDNKVAGNDGTANANDNKVVIAGDGTAEKKALLDKLYHFEEIQFCPPAAPKLNVISPTATSGLFRESAITEDLVKPEGPAVEYHCNSCSADCSRKRYHCQKQADFDLCTECFTNGKFGSGMSSSDFILMVPGEAGGVNGGKWTDQETLLLLEALELYKENWNEIAEHVATKTKAQCILHFVQMPIEDIFLDHNDEEDSDPKETTDPAATQDGDAVSKDVPETSESKAGADEGPSQITPMETSNTENAAEAKISEDTQKPEDDDTVQVTDEMSKPEVNNDGKSSPETGENIALQALREAFEAVGYPPTPEGPNSFAEVGNPVMALAAFLSLLVGSDIATVSARSSLKSISGNSPAMGLAARHCFILEDPPSFMKEQTCAESTVAKIADVEAQQGGNSESRNEREDVSTSVSAEKDLTNDQSNKTVEDSIPEDMRLPASTDVKSAEKSNSAKEPQNTVTAENAESGKVNESSCAELLEENPKSSKPPSSETQIGEGATVGGDPSPVGVAKEVAPLPDALPEKDAGQQVASNSLSESLQPSSATKDVNSVPESLPSQNKESEQPVMSNSKGDLSQPTELKDVDTVSNSLPSEVNEPRTEPENGTTTGDDQTKGNKEEKLESEEKKDECAIDKLKHAAITALSAAAVKAKLLAEQEEDQIQLLATSLIDKQLQKLETKLAFFNEMDNMTLRVRDQLERSKQKLFYERAQIIQARLGLAGSSSRPMPSAIPPNRIPMNFANSMARPPMSMAFPRPPISRPPGTAPSTPSIPFTSTTMAGSSIQPSGQDKASSVGSQ